MHFRTLQLQKPAQAQCSAPLHPVMPTYLNWCSREPRILEEKRSASFSRLREYSSSISAFLRKNSCRSCSSCRRDSDCCSRHLNCSTSCVRISGDTQGRKNRLSYSYTRRAIRAPGASLPQFKVQQSKQNENRKIPFTSLTSKTFSVKIIIYISTPNLSCRAVRLPL